MSVKKNYQRPLDIKNGHVDMNHGAGGRASHQLIQDVFFAAFNNEWLSQGHDATTLPDPAALGLGPGRWVVATDAHVISPLFFAGGDIGSLAVHGTVNDVAMAGAKPLYLTASFILEEGLPLRDVQRIAQSMAAAAREAGVSIVAGDTKVVERGKGDGVFISTTGMGWLSDGVCTQGHRARPGDVILVSGTLGDHGVAILSQREGLEFETAILSDSAALNGLVADVLLALPDAEMLRVLRDPTRGGLATTLNEIAAQSGVGILLNESDIPVHPQVDAACELLGLDPLYVANEGKMIVICDPSVQDVVLERLRAHPLGQQAACIGRVVAEGAGFVRMTTGLGGQRMVDWLTGEQLPRIC